jgi:hypothetical protein
MDDEDEREQFIAICLWRDAAASSRHDVNLMLAASAPWLRPRAVVDLEDWELLIEERPVPRQVD